MQVQVSGKHLAVGDALKSRITDELNTIIDKYFERGGISAEVVVARDGHEICVDLVVRLASGQQLDASGQGGDAHTALDAALAKIERRVRRYKRRLKNHHHPGAREAVESAPLLGMLPVETMRWLSWAVGDLSVKLVIAVFALIPYRLIAARWSQPAAA